VNTEAKLLNKILAEKAFDKIQHPFMMKRRNIPQHNKDHYK
jgi:hypothetical protein